MSSITGIHGGQQISTEPNERLIANLRDLLNDAETGQLQSFIGTGFTQSGFVLTSWGDFHSNIYEMLGALAWLQVEYTKRCSPEVEQ